MYRGRETRTKIIKYERCFDMIAPIVRAHAGIVVVVVGVI